MSRQGFSLLELSVVLTIISIVVAGGLTLGTAKTQQIKIESSYEEMKEVANAISVFVAQNNRLPCPASAVVLPGTATYGREGTCPGTAATVVYGDVPFYDLGLPDEYGSDAWNRRYRYTVMDDATTAFSSTYAGSALVVNDNGSTGVPGGTAISGQIAYLLASAGKTGKGAAPTKSISIIASTVTDKDYENWDNDGTFRDGTYNDGEVTAQFYDDILIWKTVNSIYNVSAGGSGSAAGGVPLSIIATSASNNGNFGNYLAMATFINANGCAAASGYKVCTVTDAAKYFHENAILATDGWVSGDGQTQDCNGWTASTGADGGIIWRSSGTFSRDTCDSSHVILCCKWE
ncbi:MAG: type II secretion system protein [Rickettsiales bacterium]|nr:type II secretion system protein [Rickettsiales bacterium]